MSNFIDVTKLHNFPMEGTSWIFLVGSGMYSHGRSFAGGGLIPLLLQEVAGAPALDVNFVSSNGLVSDNYRRSYGVFYHIDNINKTVDTGTVAAQRTEMALADFAFAICFYIDTAGDRTIFSRRYSNASANDFSYILKYTVASNALYWQSYGSAAASHSIAFLNAIVLNTWMIFYVRKATGAPFSAGYKRKGQASWTQGVSGQTNDPVYSTSYDFHLGCGTDTAAAPGARIGNMVGGIGRFAYWTAAESVAVLEAGIEDHFGAANAASGGGGIPGVGAGRGIG